MDSQTWQRCVEDAKLLLMSRSAARARVCELAVIACEIKWGGGGHWSDFEDQFTIKQFAYEIGVHPKTMMNWLATYRYVYLNLPAHFQNDNFNWTYGERCKRQLKKRKVDENSNKEITKAYTTLLNQSPIERMTRTVEQYIKNILHNYRKLNNDEDREDFEYMVSEMLEKMVQIRLHQRDND